MPIEFRCGQCDQLLRTGDETAGRQARCPECGNIEQIPNASTEPSDPLGSARSESPFSADVPPPAAAGGSENPYQSPGDFDHREGTEPVGSHADLAAYARDRVSTPAILLIVCGGLALLIHIPALLGRFFGLAFMGPQMLGPMAIGGGMALASSSVAIVLSLLMVAGGLKMQKLDNYALAITGAIVAVLPCAGPCCLFSLPIGIWSLVVLSDKKVQAAFSTGVSR